MTGSNVESNGERPGVKLKVAACQADTASQEWSLRPRLIAGVQGSWAGASHSRVLPHATTA